MALFDRLTGKVENDKIAVHTFMALLGEYARGVLSEADIVKHYGLDAQDQADLRTFFLDKQDQKAKAGDNTREYASVVHDILILSEVRFQGYADPDEVIGKLKALL